MAHRVFLVEDHDWVRQMLSRLLSLQPDLEVVGAAESAEEALSTLPDGVDVVLLDLALEDSSGFDLLKTLRARRPELPCIILSGKPAIEYAGAARDAGAAHFVEKGDAPALLAAIHDVLGPTTPSDPDA